MKPIVTIGICVRNSEDFIRDTVDSLIDQDFPHELMEVIFVDDGSTDRTLSIIQEYVSKMDVQVKVYHHEWKGLGATRNMVVNNADGDYIIWVDGDMRLSRDFVRKQVEFMKRNPTVGISKGRYGMYNEAKLVATLENVEYLVDHRKDKEKAMPTSLGTGGSIYRVKAIRQVGGFDPNIRGAGEDTDAEHRIRKAGWLLCRTQAVFYEIRRETWRAVWGEYFWRGYGGHYVVHKNSVRALSTLHRMFPPATILEEVLLSFDAYRTIHRKAVFLLPFHWAFKRIAWCLGYAKSYTKRH